MRMPDDLLSALQLLLKFSASNLGDIFAQGFSQCHAVSSHPLQSLYDVLDVACDPGAPWVKMSVDISGHRDAEPGVRKVFFGEGLNLVE